MRYAGTIYDEDELRNVLDVALSGDYTYGAYIPAFERKLAEYLSVRHAHLVNSGSAANLLAFFALTSRKLGDRRIERGDEVITVAAGFPTTVSPILMYGAVPVFVDVTLPTYNVDVSQLEDALTSKTKAVMIAHTLGNPFDLKEVLHFCRKHDLWLVEDNCDALGAEYDFLSDGIVLPKKTGTFGHIGTSSFYPPHHISLGQGGAVYTDSDLLSEILVSMRDWGRDCTCPPGVDNSCGRRFSGQYGSLPRGYDHKYVYAELGFNLASTETSAALGVAQLDKLPSFVEARRQNFAYLHAMLARLEHLGDIILPKATEHSYPSWFGFPITMDKGLKSRNDMVRSLEAAGVQTRMLFGGNLTRQPMMEGHHYRALPLKTTDRIATDTFWVGVWPGLSKEDIERMAELITVELTECV